MLTKVKLALRISGSALDNELEDLIAAARADLLLAGVSASVTNNPKRYPLVRQAIVTYCKLNFGQPDNAERLAASYDEQKAQLRTATGYTEWGGE